MIIAKEKGNTKIICKSKCIRFLRHELEQLAFDYSNKYQVIPFEFYEKSKSRNWGKVPLGIFMIYKPNKITVYRKSIRGGWLYNSIHIEKLCVFSLIEPEKIIESYEYEITMSVESKKQYFTKVHQDIINKQKTEELQI